LHAKVGSGILPRTAHSCFRPYEGFHGKALGCPSNLSELDTEIPSYTLYSCFPFEPNDFAYIDEDTPAIAVFNHLQPIFQNLLAVRTRIEASASQHSDLTVVRPSRNSTLGRCRVILDRLQRRISTPLPGKLHCMLPGFRFERLTETLVFQSFLQDISALFPISRIKQHVAVVHDFRQ